MEDELLLNEKPLEFSPTLAVAIGLKEAIVLHRIYFWLNINESKGYNYIKGRYWTYNTYKEWQKQFSFWSRKTVERIITNLEYMGIVDSAYLRGDRRKFYSINYSELREIDSLSEYSYNIFLKSEYWKNIAEKVKRLNGYKCAICGGDESIEVHHKTYKHHREEHLYWKTDLICLCGECHKKAHNIKGAK